MILLTSVTCQAQGVKEQGRDTIRQSQPVAPVYLRTNLLLPLLNAGAECPLGDSWSVGADVYWPWMPRNASHKSCTQAFGVGVEGRYWLGSDRRPGSRLLGHSVGAFGMWGYYDLGRNYTGDQGHFYAGGLDYLYAKPIFKGKMHLELSLGVGYFYSNSIHYRVYEEGGKGYHDRLYRNKRSYIGPLKASVSLVLPLQGGKSKSKTGKKR